MGSLGLPELAFIFVLALLIFGPKKLPEIGRTLGKGMAEFRKATNELKRSINTELALDELPKPSSLRSLAVQGLQDIEREVSEQASPAALETAQEPGEAPARTEPRAAAPPPTTEPEPVAAPEAAESR